MKSYEVLRKLMFDKKIRKADVIRGAKVSRPTLDKWEKGEEPSLATMRKVARFFGVDVKVFIQ